MKSKKGTSFYILVVTLVLIFAMFFMIFKLLDKYDQVSKNKTIGTRQAELFHIYQKGERALLYVDQAARISSEQAVYDFAKQGGLGLNEMNCDRYKGYAVWDFSKNCVPDKQNMQFYINDNLNAYFEKYPDKDVFIPPNNYNFDVKDNNGKITIVGIADLPLKIEVDR